MQNNNQKQNILFVLPTLRRGGAETQLIDLVNAIDQSQFNKTILIFDKNIEQLSRINRQTVDFHQCSRSTKYDVSIFWKIAKLIDEKEIDVIHCTIQVSMLVAQMSALLAKRRPKILLAIHGTASFNRKYELADKYLYRYLMKYCQRILFVCRKQAEYWINKFPELEPLSVVIYNGVDTVFFNRQASIAQGLTLKQQLGILKDTPVITCIAGFRKVKGHQYLIDAFARLPSGVNLLLVGDGETKTLIEKQVKEKQLENRVKFLGELADVRPVLTITDVTVLSSKSEAFSMAMLESMSMGVPMVATDTGGLAEAIIPGETGDLVPPKDVEALAKALSQYINNQDYSTNIGVKARSLVVEKFSKKNMVKVTEKVLLEAQN